MDVKTADKYFIANTYSRADVVFVSGKGSVLTDDCGKEYIDFGSGIAVNVLGHSYAPWVQAVKAQTDKIAHTSNLYFSEPCVRLAEKLNERTGMKKVFFSNSGAEANECAIKCARKYSFDKYGVGRGKIVTLKGSFHGRTLATLTATGQDVFHNYFFPFPAGFDYAEPNDFDDLKQKADKETCAVMIELVQGEGGVMALNHDFVRKTEEFCRENDILLIVDEVQTGNGRTGSLYAYMQYGIKPDIVTTAKGLAGGLPLGATMMWDKCENTLSAGTHGSTFGGNPVACAGACAVLDGLTDSLMESVKEKAAEINNALSKMKKVKSVSGMGLMIGIETQGISAADAVKEFREKGLIVLTAKNKIRLLPALNISRENIETGLKIMSEVLK